MHLVVHPYLSLEQASKTSPSTPQMRSSHMSISWVRIEEGSRPPHEDLSQRSRLKRCHVQMSASELFICKHGISSKRQLQSTHPETAPISLPPTNSITFSPPRRSSITIKELERQREFSNCRHAGQF